MSLPIPFPSGELIQQKTSIGYARDLWIPSSFDYDVFEDKFWGDAINPLYPSAAGDTGTVTFTEHNENGYLEFKTTSGNDKSAGQGMGHQFTGDRGLLAEFIIVLPAAITTMKFEVGLSDSTAHDGTVNVKATPSITATDCAVFVFDIDDITNDTYFGFISAKGGTIVETVDIANPVASSTLRIAVRVEGDSVSAYLNGTQVAGHDAGIEGGTKLTPWVYIQNRGGTERIIQLHKWRVIQPAY